MTNIISRENLETNLIAEGKTTEDLSEYQYSEVTLKEDNRRLNSDKELNSHARLACYTMNKTGVASGSFS